MPVWRTEIHFKILRRYVTWPWFQLFVLGILTRLYLLAYPKVPEDMFGNLLEAVWAAFLVWGVTVIYDFFTKSIPVLRRVWIFKGCRRVNVAYANAVGCVLGVDHARVARANLTNHPVQINGVTLRLAASCEKPASTSPHPPGGFFYIPNPVPDSEVRAFKYLVKGFPEIDFDFVPDTDAMNTDIPILALGSEGSNYCTAQIMTAIGFDGFVSGNPTAYQILSSSNSTGMNFDYGVIALTTYNGQLGITCWGLGTTGTAGAAWFLANRFWDLVRALDGNYDSDFVVLLRFPHGNEIQGELLRIYRGDAISNFASGL